jgi:hypothetical protein
MNKPLIWHGTPDEFILLRHIVDRNCQASGVPCAAGRRCASHSLLVDTQRGLDDLLFGKRIGDQLLAEENA